MSKHCAQATAIVFQNISCGATIVQVQSRWDMPPDGWFSLLTDGARCCQSSLASCGAITKLFNRDWNVHICHIGRTANKIVDSLAKISRAMHVSPLREVDSSCHLFLQPPPEALVVFHDNLSCVMGVNPTNYD
ncbi:hypothetical protein V6N11_064846 [Hibiscus sabdariffa]|uniref:Uncharacterized protein n=2 Tax=Hibiscus sabdariffa TaxID=183260 RepID=A0ABR2SIC9_9ROSI